MSVGPGSIGAPPSVEPAMVNWTGTAAAKVNEPSPWGMRAPGAAGADWVSVRVVSSPASKERGRAMPPG